MATQSRTSDLDQGQVRLGRHFGWPTVQDVRVDDENEG